MRRGWSREKKHEQYMQVMVMMTLMIIVMMIVIMMIMVMKVLILMMKRIYMQVMEAVTLFTDIVQFPNLHKLDHLPCGKLDLGEPLAKVHEGCP